VSFELSISETKGFVLILVLWVWKNRMPLVILEVSDSSLSSLSVCLMDISDYWHSLQHTTASEWQLLRQASAPQLRYKLCRMQYSSKALHWTTGSHMPLATPPLNATLHKQYTTQSISDVWDQQLIQVQTCTRNWSKYN